MKNMFEKTAGAALLAASLLSGEAAQAGDASLTLVSTQMEAQDNFISIDVDTSSVKMGATYSSVTIAAPGANLSACPHFEAAQHPHKVAVTGLSSATVTATGTPQEIKKVIASKCVVIRGRFPE